MMGHWHIPAISIVAIFLIIQFQIHLLMIIYFLWLFYLLHDNRLGKMPTIISLITFLFFSFHIPFIVTTQTEEQENKLIQMSGKISGQINSTDKKIEFLLKNGKSTEKYMVVYFLNKTDNNKTLDMNTFKHGARCLVQGTIQNQDGKRNPGQFDYKKYLLKNGISHQIIIDDLENVTCSGSSYLHKVYEFRNHLLNKVEHNYSPLLSSWLKALVIGDHSSIDESIVEMFQRWGLSHILAISGLHVGIIVALLYFSLVKSNIFTKEKSQWLIIFFLPFYALIAGGEPSVLRASLMVLVFVLLNKLKMKLSMTDVLSIVFILLIILDKYIVYHIGFQLSFLVTFGLILSKSWLMQTDSPILNLLQISFVSQMMIIPLQITYFHTFSPLSIIANVFVVPYFSLFVIPTVFFLLILLLLPFPLFFIQFLDNLFVVIHTKMLDILITIDQVAYYPLLIGEISLGITFLYYVIFILFMNFIQKQNKLQAVILGCILSFYIIFLAVRPYLSPEGTVTMLDIGQGDAFVIELPYRKGVILMDVGSTFSFDDFTPNDSVYKQIIKPYLYSRGISKIDAIFISHEHVDHNGSISFIVEDFNVEQIMISHVYELNEEIARNWQAHGAEINIKDVNEEIVLGDHSFYIISPLKDFLDANENSLVIFTILGGKRWLFTGDIEQQAEKDLMNVYKDLSVDVLKVAHHGSDTSTHSDFINHINPSYALISVGINNSYGHPASHVLERLDSSGAIVLRTDRNGAIQYKFKNSEGTFFKQLP